MRLKDKTAVITGGGTGIGRATAILFAKEGAKVCIVGRRLKPLEETVAFIQSEGGMAICLECDVSKADEVQRVVDIALNTFGKIDILYNNAAIVTGLGKDIVELSEDEWDSLMSVNLKGVFLCSKYIIPHMIKNGGGVIVNCSSISGLLGQRKMGAYSAAKGGIEVLTKCMALDFAEYKIRVNAVSPAWVETVLNREKIMEEKEEVLRMHPIGRVG
ncbi:MAG: SDR family NAD(P)-dependent oxidoreductase, partial [Clostridiales bacterium]|nr:SDR family NAD(P)-dependent oxidoreductase [Clostridiales bacterium]